MADRKKRLYVMGLVLAGLGLAGVAGVVLLPAVSWAQGPNRVALVVGLGDGEVLTRCVAFDEDQISGLDLLLRTDLEVLYEVAGGAGTKVCSIQGEGCDYPNQDCFCECPGGPNCVYWSYWHLKNGAWQYSPVGGGAYSVSDGAVEGWAWGVELPDLTFGDICAAPPTATASHTPTTAPTPTRTNTPQPTHTPKPPTIAYFKADRAAISAGESVTLSWDLADAQVAYLRYAGTEEGVIAPGSRTVTPSTNTVYTLVARNAGGETTLQLSITVSPASQLSPSPTRPAATETVAPSTTRAPASPPPAVTEAPASPEAVAMLATQTPLPQPTPEATQAQAPSPTRPPQVEASPTATPVPVAAAVTPAQRIEQQATRPALLRDTSQRPSSGFPVYVLGVVGVVALLGGAVGIVVILLMVRRGAR